VPCGLLVMMYTQGCFMPEIVRLGCVFENRPAVLGLGACNELCAASIQTNHRSAQLRSGMWTATAALRPRGDGIKYAATRNDEKNTRHPEGCRPVGLAMTGALPCCGFEKTGLSATRVKNSLRSRIVTSNREQKILKIKPTPKYSK
jgi:hypothetical protein